MKPRLFFLSLLAMAASATLLWSAIPGVVEWSDGRKVEGAISLTPGKDIRLFEVKTQASIRLEDVSEIAMAPEKEEMREGFTFAEPGQAKQEKNGEIYPVRYLKATVTLRDGKILAGHLYTTVFYIESEEKTEKLVLLAKQTGKVGQKVEDVVYPKRIRLQGSTRATASSCRIDLGLPTMQGIKSIVVFSKPDLTLLDATREGSSQVWSIPLGDPMRILFAAEMPNGLCVAWPANNHAEAAAAVEASLASKEMKDFYDKRTLLGCFAEGEEGDVYSLVLMVRTEQTHSFKSDQKPWSICVLRWKYDAGEKKTTLLNRVNLFSGRAEGDVPLPHATLDAKLLERISAAPMQNGKGATP